MKWVEKVVYDVRPDFVVNLGDTFHNHAIVRSEILTEFDQHLKRLVRVGVDYGYVLGNHDMFTPKDSKYHALQTLGPYGDSFQVFDELRVIGDITFVPYVHDFKDFPVINTPICIAHQTFIGCDYGYYRPDVGVDADNVGAEIIISGHIHKRQTFGKVIYPGTPYAQGVDDINQSKGLMLFDTKSYKYEFIESPFPQWKGMKFDISSEFSITDMQDRIISDISGLDNWVIDIAGPKAEISTFLDSKCATQLRKQNKIRFRVKYTDKLKEAVRLHATSTEDILFQYIDRVYDGAIDKSLLRDKALEIFNKTGA